MISLIMDFGVQILLGCVIPVLYFVLSYFCLFFYRFIHFHHCFPIYRVPHIRCDL